MGIKIRIGAITLVLVSAGALALAASADQPGSEPPWKEGATEADEDRDVEARPDEPSEGSLSAKSSPTSGTQDDDFVVIDDDSHIPLPPPGTVELHQDGAPDVVLGGGSYVPPTTPEPVGGQPAVESEVGWVGPGGVVRRRSVLQDRELSDRDLPDRELSDISAGELSDRDLPERDLSDRDLTDRDLGDRQR